MHLQFDYHERNGSVVQTTERDKLVVINDFSFFPSVKHHVRGQSERMLSTRSVSFYAYGDN